MTMTRAKPKPTAPGSPPAPPRQAGGLVVQVDPQQLAAAVSWIARLLPGRPAHWVEAAVRLDAIHSTDSGTLVVSGFDYEISSSVDLTADHGCHVKAGGSVLVSARLLAEITKLLPNQPVALDVDGGRLGLACGPARYRLPLMPVGDYPALPDPPPATGTVEVEEFSAAVAKVAVAAGRDRTLELLTAIQILAGPTLRLAATDRYRAAVADLPWKPATTELEVAEALVPADVLAATAKAHASDGGTLTLGIDSGGHGGVLGLTSTRRRTTTRLFAGEFPNVYQLFGNRHSTSTNVAARDLAAAVRRAAAITGDGPVRLVTNGDEVAVRAGDSTDDTIGDATETVPCQHTGPDITLAFNPRYLLDALTSLGGPTVTLSATEPTKPVLLTGAGDAGDTDSGNTKAEPTLRHLLVPMRLRDA